MEKKVIYCASCGTPNFAGSRYCTQCGTAIVLPTPRGAKSKTAAAPQVIAAPQAPAAPGAAPASVSALLESIPVWVWPLLIVVVVALSYFAFSGRGIGGAVSADAGDPGAQAPLIAGGDSGAPAPGWQQFSTDDFSIWLPEGFIGGETAEDAERLQQALREGGHEMQAESFDFGSLSFSEVPLKLFAVNPADGSQMADMLMVMGASGPEYTTMDEAIASFADMSYLSPNAKFEEIDGFTLTGYETYASKMTFEGTDTIGFDLSQFVFILMRGDDAWVLMYTSDFSGSDLTEGDVIRIAESFEAR